MGDETLVAFTRGRTEPLMQQRRNPWGWLTEARLTYALKLLLVIALLMYLGNLALVFVDRIGGLLYIIVGAIFLAYLVYPAVHRLSARMSHRWAIAIVYLSLLVLVIFGLYFFVPRISEDVKAVAQHAPELAATYKAYLSNPRDPVLSRLPDSVRAEMLKFPQYGTDWVRTHGAEAAGHVVSILAGAFSLVATFVIIPLLSIYLLADLNRLRNGLYQIVPRERWAAASKLMGEIDGVIGGFIRGQLIVAVTVGILLTIALLILHVPYAFLLGLIAAVGDLVPYVGAVLTFIPAVGIAALNNGWTNASIVAVVFIAIYQLEGHIISPMIVSSQVKLSPLVVLLAVLIGAELGGIFGMLIAVPVAGALRVILLNLANQEAA
jgi:predicted PurR-regulated permease PerM